HSGNLRMAATPGSIFRTTKDYRKELWESSELPFHLPIPTIFTRSLKQKKAEYSVHATEETRGSKRVTIERYVNAHGITLAFTLIPKMKKLSTFRMCNFIDQKMVEKRLAEFLLLMEIITISGFRRTIH